MIVSYIKEELDTFTSLDEEIETEMLDYLADYITYYTVNNSNYIPKGVC